MSSDCPSLEIVIVNWNAGAQLAACIGSIPGAATAPVHLRRVCVVDNASTDGSADDLRDFDLPLEILRNRENRGFSAACNQGGLESRADYLLFLNPDTRLEADSLRRPLAFLEGAEGDGVGVCGIRLADTDGEVLRSCARFPSPVTFFHRMTGLDLLAPRRFPGLLMREWDHRTTLEVDHVSGAFYLIRRQLFEQLGGFDERFFVYLEDLDLSVRVHASGWRTVFLADAKAYHRGGGTSEQVKARRLFYSLRSQILYAWKHFNAPSAVVVTLGTLMLEPVARLIRSLIRLSARQAVETAEGYLLLWRAVPAILRVAWGAQRG